MAAVPLSLLLLLWKYLALCTGGFIYVLKERMHHEVLFSMNIWLWAWLSVLLMPAAPLAQWWKSLSWFCEAMGCGFKFHYNYEVYKIIQVKVLACFNTCLKTSHCLFCRLLRWLPVCWSSFVTSHKTCILAAHASASGFQHCVYYNMLHSFKFFIDLKTPLHCCLFHKPLVVSVTGP